MNFAPTQAPRGYNQHAAYVAGLSTQLGNKAGLKFRHDNGANGAQLDFLAKARKPVYITDDEDEPRPRRGGGEGGEREGSLSEYELGSFICNDEDVDYASESVVLSWDTAGPGRIADQRLSPNTQRPARLVLRVVCSTQFLELGGGAMLYAWDRRQCLRTTDVGVR